MHCSKCQWTGPCMFGRRCPLCKDRFVRIELITTDGSTTSQVPDEESGTFFITCVTLTGHSQYEIMEA
jgi:hypothetical protein